MSSGSDSAAQLRVQRLDGIRGVDDASHAFGEREEWDHELPVAAPALRDRWILYAPRSLCEGIEGGLAGGCIGGAIDRAQCLRHALAILPGGKIHGMADQVDDASLHDGLRKNGVDGLRKTLQAIEDGAQKVLCSPGLELADDAQPEFGALGLFDPDAENLLGAVRQHP